MGGSLQHAITQHYTTCSVNELINVLIMNFMSLMNNNV